MYPLRWLLALALLLALTGAATADARFSEVLGFGDSQVEAGNLNIATGGAIAPPPYFSGRLSNGPVWVDVLAKRLGLDALEPSLAGGSNFAWGGAEAGDGLSSVDTPNVGAQLDTFLDEWGAFTGRELIVISAGGSDILFNDFSARQSVRNLTEQITRMADAGGRTFLVPNLPPYERSPFVGGTADEARVTTRIAQVNDLLERELPRLAKRLHITIHQLDVAGLLAEMLDHPRAFGLTNVTDPAFPAGGLGDPEPDGDKNVVPRPDKYFWWDSVHFTRVVHEQIGRLASSIVAAGSD